MKKVLSLVLAMVLVIGVIPVTGMAYIGGREVRVNDVELTESITIYTTDVSATDYGITSYDGVNPGSISLDTSTHTITLDNVIITANKTETYYTPDPHTYTKAAFTCDYHGNNTRVYINIASPSKIIGRFSGSRYTLSGSPLEIIGTIGISNGGMDTTFDNINLTVTAKDSLAFSASSYGIIIKDSTIKVKASSSTSELVNGMQIPLGSVISNSNITVEAPGTGIKLSKNDNDALNFDINNSNITIKGGEYGLVTVFQSYDGSKFTYIEGELNITGGEDNYIKAEGSVQAFKISTDTDKLNAPAEYVTLITNAGTKGYIGVVTEDGEPAAEELEEADPNITFLVNGIAYTSPFGNDTAVVKDKKTFDVDCSKYIVDITDAKHENSLLDVDVQSIILTNAIHEKLARGDKDVEFVFDRATVDVNVQPTSLYKKTSMRVYNQLQLSVRDAFAKHWQKKAMNTSKVISELAINYNGYFESYDGNITVFVPVDCENTKVFYLIDDYTIGTVPCDTINNTCVFNLYKNGTYVICQD